MIVNHLIELDLDGCLLDFGLGACTATNATGYECYKTKNTCQDEANFSKTTNTIVLSEINNAVYPDAIPCVEDIEFAPTEINPKEGLDYLGKLTLKVKDFAHHDRGLDPYVDTRSYIATDQGTFWGKLLARNPHYFARNIRVKQIVGGVVTQTYNFVIESISPPDSSGMVKIIAKDPLFLAGAEKSTVLEASSGQLDGAITDSATTLLLDDATEYPASGTVRIGSEILSYAAKSGESLTGLVRGLWGTEANSHSDENGVQICKTYVNEPLIDVVNDLIANHTPIDNAYIPYADWQIEESDWLAVYTLTNCISDPDVSVMELLTQIQVETGTLIWWDQEEQDIKLKASVPRTQNQSIDMLTDGVNLMPPVKIKDGIEDRVSQVWIYYGVYDYTGTDEAANYANLVTRADYDSESASEYGTASIEVIYSRWMTGIAQAGQVASRKLARYKNPPKMLSFSLDSKDSALKTGDHFYLRTASIQSKTGAPRDVEMQMLSMRYFPKSLSFACKAQSFNYLLNEIYGYIAPDATPDYTSATDTQKNTMGFICGDDGKMSDGNDGYLII